MSGCVITGVGAVSAFGVGLSPLLDALAEGMRAVGPIRHFDVSSFATKVAGEVQVQVIDADWLRVIGVPGADREALAASGLLRDRKVGFALAAALEAWRAAGCGDAEREAALVLALGLEQAFLEDFAPLRTATGGLDFTADASVAAPPVRLRSRADLASEWVRRVLDLEGLAMVNVSACAAGGLAIAQGAALIERGLASIVLAGGADSMVNPLGLGGMSRLGAPSPRAAHDACRPFDRRRDGLAIGEGAAVFVLESAARAQARGARPLARVLGWGSTQDAYRVTAPRPDGARARLAMQRALTRAGLAPEAIGYITAHGTGTPLNDPAEAQAIASLFPRGVPVSSIKGAVGHLMAAAGALELAACMLPFSHDLLPGTANHLERDPACAIDVIGEAPRRARIDALMSNSFGFGGQNVAVVLGRA